MEGVPPPQRLTPGGSSFKWLAGISEAPTFRPTDEEFADCIAYIEKIRPIGERYGICKIIPPASWKPPFSLDTEHFKFSTRKQKVNELEGESRVNMNFVDGLVKFHAQHGWEITKMPVLGRIPVDLFLLKKLIDKRGGHEKVTKEKRWAEVGRELGVSSQTLTSLSFNLKNIYVKYVAPYETYLASQKRAPGPAAAAAAPPKPEVIQEGTPPKTPMEEEKCDRCQSGQNEHLLLLCDGENCNRAFHTYCLTPALNAIPKTEWFCPKCLSADDFGFEDGNDYDMETFKQHAASFKEDWFKHLGRPPVEQDIENEFWNNVDPNGNSVEVEYGADLHSSRYGSGFPTIERFPLDKYSFCGWNLNNLPVLPDSLFRFIKNDISGMMVPWLYVGMCFSTFCWHNEDHYTYSINYLHMGDIKTWYGVPSSDAEKFEDAMREAVPELFASNPDLLFHLTTMLSPETLIKKNVKVFRIHQRAGEFVVTFPQAYHAGFNQGMNIAEAVNFAPLDWTPYGLKCMLRYQEHGRAPVFSHEELICTVLKQESSVKTAIWLKSQLDSFVERETHQRNELRAKNVREELDSETLAADGEVTCAKCNTFCYASAVGCTGCGKTKHVCMLHFENLCTCEPDKKVLKIRVTEAELAALQADVNARAQEPEEWRKRLQAYLSSQTVMNIKELQQYQADGEKFGIDLDELRTLRQFIEKAQAVSATAVSMVARRHQTRKVTSGDDPLTLGGIADVIEQAAQMMLDSQEITDLKSFEREAMEVHRSLKSAIASNDLPINALERLLSHVRDSGVEFEETPDLQLKIEQMQWDLDTTAYLAGEPNDETLDDLLADGRKLGLTETSLMASLRQQRQLASRWNDQVEQYRKAPMKCEVVGTLVEEGKKLPVNRALLRDMDSLYQSGVHWIKLARRYFGLPSGDLRDQDEDGSELDNQNPSSQGKMDLDDLDDAAAAGRKARRAKPSLIELQAHLERKVIASFLFEEHEPLVRLGRAADDWGLQVRSVLTRKGGKSLSELIVQIKKNLGLIPANPSEPDVYCLCREKQSGFMVQCVACDEWLHGKCLRQTKKELEEREDYICPVCEPSQQVHYPSRFPPIEELKQAATEGDALAVRVDEIEDIVDIVSGIEVWQRKARAAIAQFAANPTLEGLPALRDRLREGHAIMVLTPELEDLKATILKANVDLSVFEELQRRLQREREEEAERERQAAEMARLEEERRRLDDERRRQEEEFRRMEEERMRAAREEVRQADLQAQIEKLEAEKRKWEQERDKVDDDRKRKGTKKQDSKSRASANGANAAAPDASGWCICGASDEDGDWIMCDDKACQKWYHIQCVGVAKKIFKAIESYRCPKCCEAKGEPYPYEARPAKAGAKKRKSTVLEDSPDGGDPYAHRISVSGKDIPAGGKGLPVVAGIPMAAANGYPPAKVPKLEKAPKAEKLPRVPKALRNAAATLGIPPGWMGLPAGAMGIPPTSATMGLPGAPMGFPMGVPVASMGMPGMGLPMGMAGLPPTGAPGMPQIVHPGVHVMTNDQTLQHQQQQQQQQQQHGFPTYPQSYGAPGMPGFM